MNIAIIEVSESHEECIYSQVSFLKDAGHNIDLFIHPKIKSQINDYVHLIKNITIIDFETPSLFHRLKLQQRLFNNLKKYDRIVFNTASSSKTVRNLCVLLKFSKVECIGILHNVKKLEKSFTQRIISYKIKKYFVLNDFLKLNKKPKNIKIESFYPIFFPKYDKDNTIKKEHIWITIPGRIYFDKRDYHSLLDMLENQKIPTELKFIILGNINTKDGSNFMESILNKGLKNHFMFFQEHILNRDFYNYIDKSDYIMPLLQKEGKNYLQYKITGAFNLAFAFKKRLFCEKDFNCIPDLKQNGIFYTEENFISSLHKVLHKEKNEIYKDKKWSYTYQKNRYINFIE